MPTLSSLLVQRGAASMRAVEDAIARQVFQGGDLATNLLELGAVREEALLKVLAEAHGLEPALTGPLTPPPAEVLRVLPADLAARHGLFPVKLQDRVLWVAVSQPLAQAVEDDLGFALDLALRQVITTQLRIRQAIAGCYGIPLDRRLLRLQARLDGHGEPTPSATPPPERDLLSVRMPAAISIPAPTFASGLPDSERAPRLRAMPAPKAPFVDTQQDLLNPAIPKSPAVPAPLIATGEDTPSAGPAHDGDAASQIQGTGVPGTGAAVVHTHPWAPPRDDVSEQPAAPPVPQQRPSATPVADTIRGPEPDNTPPSGPPEVEAPRKRISTRALAGVLRDAILEERALDKRRAPAWQAAEPRRAPHAPLERRRKGPVTAARAEAELEAASSTDEVLETLFAFAHQFFEYAALFVVHGDLAEGRDASGPGADRAALTGVGIPLDLPSHLATARARAAPVIGRPSSGLDADIARDLKRTREVFRAVAYLPVVVRGRTVAVLWGDDGEADVDLAAIGEVVAVMSLGGTALERVALRKKLGSRAPETTFARRLPEGAAALVRSFGQRPDAEPPPAVSAEGESAARITTRSRVVAEEPAEGPPRPKVLADQPSAQRPRLATPPPIDREEPDVGEAARRRSARRASSVPPRETRSSESFAEHRELVQRVVEGGPAGQAAFEELVRAGDHVVQVVMARFPGPLRVDRHRARGELPPASQCGPILELVVALRRSALPFVSVRSSAQDPEVRFWATHTLGELRFPEAATVLIPRLFDDDAPVRRIARRSAAAPVGSGPAGAPILKGLEDITRNSDEPKVHRIVAIETMGEIRSGSLVPPLLDALDDASDDVAEAARRALLLVTRQDFGRDLDGWLAWWDEHHKQHRIEWLIDALMHEQPSVRRAAGDELKLCTKEYFGYYDDLPRRDRERAQCLYRAWWDREGRRRFTAGVTAGG